MRWSPTNVGRTHVLPHALLMGKRCTLHELYLAQHLPHTSLGGGVAPQLLHMVQQANVTVSEEHQLPALPVGRHLGGQPTLGKLKRTLVMASELRPNLWRFHERPIETYEWRERAGYTNESLLRPFPTSCRLQQHRREARDFEPVLPSLLLSK
jgi:hypothetical protein